MGKYRRDRINEEMAKELSVLIGQVKDPRVSGEMISILRTEVTPDLKYAKVYYSVLGANDPDFDAKALRQGLKSASGFLRGQIATRLNLRITPELQFIYDESIAYGARINDILHRESVQEDIRRFDERAQREAEEALAAAEAAIEAEEDEFDD